MHDVKTTPMAERVRGARVPTGAYCRCVAAQDGSALGPNSGELARSPTLVKTQRGQYTSLADPREQWDAIGDFLFEVLPNGSVITITVRG